MRERGLSALFGGRLLYTIRCVAKGDQWDLYGNRRLKSIAFHKRVNDSLLFVGNRLMVHLQSCGVCAVQQLRPVSTTMTSFSWDIAKNISCSDENTWQNTSWRYCLINSVVIVNFRSLNDYFIQWRIVYYFLIYSCFKPIWWCNSNCAAAEREYMTAC